MDKVLGKQPDAGIAHESGIKRAYNQPARYILEATGAAMSLDKTAQDPSLANIPQEFRENYLFLRELINCKEKNDAVQNGLELLAGQPLLQMRGKLNRQQKRIIKDFLNTRQSEGPRCLIPPVPPELEASIRVRVRSSWLPWEAEAIHKIERWRGDVSGIGMRLVDELSPTRVGKSLRSLATRRI